MVIKYSNEAQVLLDKRRLRVTNHRGELKCSSAHYPSTASTESVAMIQLKYTDSVVTALDIPVGSKIYGIDRDGKAFEELFSIPSIDHAKTGGETIYQWLCEGTPLKPTEIFQKYLDQEDGRNSTHCWIVVQTAASTALDVQMTYIEGAPSAMSLTSISPDKK